MVYESLCTKLSSYCTCSELHTDTGIRELEWRQRRSFCQESGRRNKARPMLRVSALCSLQWFDTDGWVTRRTSGLRKNFTPLIPRGSVPENAPKGNQLTQNQLTQVHLEREQSNENSSSNMQWITQDLIDSSVSVTELLCQRQPVLSFYTAVEHLGRTLHPAG